MEEVPTFSFYEDDVQINGNISQQAVLRECQDMFPTIHPRLMSELKYLDHANEPISIRIGDKDVFKVKFVGREEA